MSLFTRKPREVHVTYTVELDSRITVVPPEQDSTEAARCDATLLVLSLGSGIG